MKEMLFTGVRFVLIGFDSISEAQFSSEIVHNGGLDVGQYDTGCTHVIVHDRVHDDPICVAARSDGKTLVTDLWVEDSLDMGSLADANRVLYQPVKDLKGIPGAESLCMCLTGYQGTKRDNVMKMVEMMGANFVKPLIAARVTHLICYKFEGEKYELAKRTNIELVNHQWLEDCLKAWKILPTDKYKKSGLELEIMEAEARDSEEETDVGVGKNTSSHKELQTPRNLDERTPLREITEIDLNAAFAVGFNSNIPSNADIDERTLSSTPSKVSSCERILSPPEPRNRVEDYHRLTTQVHALSGEECIDVKNDEAHQYMKNPNGELVDLDKEAYNGSINTRNRKRSPHLKASEEKLGTKNFSRKALRKSLQGTSILSHSSPQGNLVNRGKDAVDISNLSLEQPKNDLKSVEVLTLSSSAEAHPMKDQSDTLLQEGKDCLSRIEVSPPKLDDKIPKKKPSAAPTCAELEQMSMYDKLENCARLCKSSSPMKDGPVIEPIVNQQGDLPKTKSTSLKKKPLQHGRTILQAKTSDAFASLSSDMVTDLPIESDKPADSRCQINYLDAMETDHYTDVRNFSRASGISAGCLVESKWDIKPESGDDTFSRLPKESSSEMAEVQKLHLEGDLTSLNTSNSSKIEKLQNPRNMINGASSCSSRKKVMAKKNMARKIRLTTGKTSQHNADMLVNLSEGLNGPMNAQDAVELDTGMGTKMPQLNPESDGKTQMELVSEALAPQTSSEIRAVEKESSFNAEKENKPAQDINVRVKSDDKARGQKPAGKSNKKPVETTMASVSVAEPEPMWFILSGHHLLRKEFQQVIRRLRGRICRDSHNWSYQATHFLVPEPVRRTEKFFAAAAAGRWILKTDYLTASNEAGKFLDEESFEWYRKGLNEDGAISLEAPRKWRQLRERTGHGAFYGMRIIIYGECIAPSLDTLKRVIKAGDGTILATSPPYTRFLKSGVDYAIVSAGMPHVDCWVQEFLKHEIPCVLTDYLVEYVCKHGYSLERHVLYKTHSWAEKSFQNLLSSSEDVVMSSSPPEDDKDDIACEVCGSRDRGEVMLICGDETGASGCGIGIHIDCCNPPLEAVPEDDWFCSKCCTNKSRSNSNGSSKGDSNSGRSTSFKRVKKRSSSVKRK
ncbi:BRCT domain-containing protein At4g02110-like [Aristolochia californica]|uniref:BRCT domain-containing protein At4g02110-like n=1 Tax=Aristolochia californica TaxID=171875 RepID=UPI0035E0AF8E